MTSTRCAGSGERHDRNDSGSENFLKRNVSGHYNPAGKFQITNSKSQTRPNSERCELFWSLVLGICLRFEICYLEFTL